MAGETDNTPVLEEPRPSLLSSVLVIAGFITLIAIVLWGLLHIATLASPWLGDLFNNDKKAAIEVVVPTEIMTGEDMTISWKHSTDAAGAYTLLYQCKDNFHFETSGESAARTIPCGVALTVASQEKSLAVKPVLSGTATTSISVAVTFVPSDATTASTSSDAAASEHAQGSAIVMVYPRPTPAPTNTTPVQPVVTQPVVQPVQTNPAIIIPVQTNNTVPAVTTVGPADLVVRIVSVNVDPSGMGVVEFDIANAGGSTSGTYTFEAFLPTQSGYTFVSDPQTPLAPGAHILNTLRFSQAVGGTVSVVVDSANLVRESNENNNFASQQIAMPYYGQYPYSY